MGEGILRPPVDFEKRLELGGIALEGMRYGRGPAEMLDSAVDRVLTV